MKMWQMKKNDLHIKKIAVRKTEKTRVKQIKKMMKNYVFISSKLLIFIHDSEIAWKITNFIWIAEKIKKTAKKNKNIKSIVDKNENENIIIKIDDNQSWLQKNFLSLKNENENKNAWIRSKNWKNREKKNQIDNDKIQRFLNHEDEEIDDLNTFEILYETNV